MDSNRICCVSHCWVNSDLRRAEAPVSGRLNKVFIRRKPRFPSCTLGCFPNYNWPARRKAMPLIGLIIGILLLIWRVFCLNNWLVHPKETLQKTIQQFRLLHKIFFFVPFLVPYKYYEQNPEYAIRSYTRGEVVNIIILVIACLLAIISILVGK